MRLFPLVFLSCNSNLKGRGLSSAAAATTGNTRRVIVSEIKVAGVPNKIDNRLSTLAVANGNIPRVDGSSIVDNEIDSPLTLAASSRFACDIVIGRHKSFSDVKPIEDGADLGPSPKEICYSALGSCTVMTIRTFFENTKGMKGWLIVNPDYITVFTLSSIYILIPVTI
jgi:hypothetical protein